MPPKRGGTASNSLKKCKICSKLACVDFADCNFCLIHYHTHVPQQQTKTICPIVISAEVMERQAEEYKALTRDALSEILLEMIDVQQLEQEKIRQDPLSILELNAPRIPQPQKAAKKRHTQEGDSSMGRPGKRINKASTGTVGGISNSSGGTSTVAPDESQEVPAPPQTSLSGGSDGGEVYFKGSRCSRCQSENTVEKFSGQISSQSIDGLKGEIWGYKDSAEVSGSRICQTTCLDCGHVKKTKVDC